MDTVDNFAVDSREAPAYPSGAWCTSSDVRSAAPCSAPIPAAATTRWRSGPPSTPRSIPWRSRRCSSTGSAGTKRSSRPALAERALTLLLVLGLLAYAAGALGVLRWWVSGLAAPAVAALLALRHRRARFAAYVFLSVVAGRALAAGLWPLALAAAAAVLLLQTPAAVRMWPRLTGPC